MRRAWLALLRLAGRSAQSGGDDPGEFLQWFPTYEEAVDAIEDFAMIIRSKYRGWTVSRPRGVGRGYALYAIPPAKGKGAR
jgi:hypothetical protein